MSANSPPPLPPAVLKLYSKRGASDCAIAALASYLRTDYEQVLIAASRVNPAVWAQGLNLKEMVRVARRLGHKAVLRRGFDIEESTGVLAVNFRDSTTEHVVLLIEGAIYEPETVPISRWDAALYLSFFNATTGLLLVVEDKK